MDQWLALLILGDLDPYTPPITPRVSLPTRSTKSHITARRGPAAAEQDHTALHLGLPHESSHEGGAHHGPAVAYVHR